MKTIVVFSPTLVTKDMLVDFVRHLGGEWDFTPSLDQGYIQRNGEIVFINGDLGLDTYYTPEQLERVQAYLGNQPKVSIDIELTHFQGEYSKRFGEDVANAIKNKWGGCTIEEIVEDDRQLA